MDAQILKIVGTVAGIGGLALGVFFLLFRALLKKIIAPQMTRDQWYKVTLTFMILVWTVALVGISAWVYSIRLNSSPKSGDERLPAAYQDNRVVSFGQTGGITAHTVTVVTNIGHRAEPSLSLVQTNVPQVVDGKFVSTYVLNLMSGFPVGNLYLSVTGKTIESIDVMPDRSGVFMRGHSGRREDHHFTNIPNFSGRLHLTVISTVLENFTIGYDIQ